MLEQSATRSEPLDPLECDTKRDRQVMIDAVMADLTVNVRSAFEEVSILGVAGARWFSGRHGSGEEKTRHSHSDAVNRDSDAM